jgi:rhodanese-related sulfurtransferase
MGIFDAFMGPPAISVQQLKAEMDAGKVNLLLDVRNLDEYTQGHAPGTLLIPLPELGARVGELTAYKGKTVHVICRSGVRSATACGILKQAGIDGVNITGGTLAWAGAGFVIER